MQAEEGVLGKRAARDEGACLGHQHDRGSRHEDRCHQGAEGVEHDEAQALVEHQRPEADHARGGPDGIAQQGALDERPIEIPKRRAQASAFGDQVAHAQADRVTVRQDREDEDRERECRTREGFGFDELLEAAPGGQPGADDQHRDGREQRPEEGLAGVAERVFPVARSGGAAFADDEQR